MTQESQPSNTSPKQESIPPKQESIPPKQESIPPSEENASPTAPYAVSPFYAFLLALLHPGIGMAYATSQWRIGLVIVVVYHVGKLMGLLLYVRTTWFPVLVGVYSLLLLVSFGFAFVAIRKARQMKIRTHTFYKVLSVVGLSVFLSSVATPRWITHTYKVNSHSMTPTIVSGDYLIVNKMAYGLWNSLSSRQIFWGPGPARGDVVVFLFPKDPRKIYIKRVIGLPGDTIELKQGLLYINGKPTPRMYKGAYTYKAWDLSRKKEITRRTMAFYESLNGKSYVTLRDQDGLSQWRNWSSYRHAKQMRPSWGPTVPKGYIFVLGDNRDRSSDSRDWGLVRKDKIIGKVLHILFSGTKNKLNWKRAGTKIQ